MYGNIFYKLCYSIINIKDIFFYFVWRSNNNIQLLIWTFYKMIIYFLKNGQLWQICSVAENSILKFNLCFITDKFLLSLTSERVQCSFSFMIFLKKHILKKVKKKKFSNPFSVYRICRNIIYIYFYNSATKFNLCWKKVRFY